MIAGLSEPSKTTKNSFAPKIIIHCICKAEKGVTIAHILNVLDAENIQAKSEWLGYSSSIKLAMHWIHNISPSGITQGQNCLFLHKAVFNPFLTTVLPQVQDVCTKIPSFVIINTFKALLWKLPLANTILSCVYSLLCIPPNCRRVFLKHNTINLWDSSDSLKWATLPSVSVIIWRIDYLSEQ